MQFLRNPGKYKSVSAFAPITNPINCPWGQKAFKGYFGEDQQEKWKEHDATELIKKWNGPELDILIDVVSTAISSPSTRGGRKYRFPGFLVHSLGLIPSSSSPSRAPATTSTNKANSYPRTSKPPPTRQVSRRESTSATSLITTIHITLWLLLQMIISSMRPSISNSV